MTPEDCRTITHPIEPFPERSLPQVPFRTAERGAKLPHGLSRRQKILVLATPRMVRRTTGYPQAVGDDPNNRD